MKLSLGFSPCPNDSFIFDALVHKKIDCEGLEFELFIEDVEQLNRRALADSLDISKLSFGAFGSVFNSYQLLDSGAALGFGAGPLILSKTHIPDFRIKIKDLRIAVPGFHTSANRLMTYFFPEGKNTHECLFSDIENELINGKADLGLVIHETRFTYQNRGLVKLADLGELWEAETKGPLPLGGIVIRKHLAEEVKQKVNRVLKRSVEYAFENPLSSRAYVRSLSQEMKDEVIASHIALYVNRFSLDLGKEGKSAVTLFLEKILRLKPEEAYFLNA